MNTNQTQRQLPTGMKHSKKVHNAFNEWTARIEEENLHIGMTITATRNTTDSRNYVIDEWEEQAEIIDLRNFDALIKFSDGTLSSSGLGFHTEAK